MGNLIDTFLKQLQGANASMGTNFSDMQNMLGGERSGAVDRSNQLYTAITGFPANSSSTATPPAPPIPPTPPVGGPPFPIFPSGRDPISSGIPTRFSGPPVAPRQRPPVSSSPNPTPPISRLPLPPMPPWLLPGAGPVLPPNNPLPNPPSQPNPSVTTRINYGRGWNPVSGPVDPTGSLGGNINNLPPPPSSLLPDPSQVTDPSQGWTGATQSQLNNDPWYWYSQGVDPTLLGWGSDWSGGGGGGGGGGNAGGGGLDLSQLGDFSNLLGL